MTCGIFLDSRCSMIDQTEQRKFRDRLDSRGRGWRLCNLPTLTTSFPLSLLIPCRVQFQFSSLSSRSETTLGGEWIPRGLRKNNNTSYIKGHYKSFLGSACDSGVTVRSRVIRCPPENVSTEFSVEMILSGHRFSHVQKLHVLATPEIFRAVYTLSSVDLLPWKTLNVSKRMTGKPWFWRQGCGMRQSRRRDAQVYGRVEERGNRHGGICQKEGEKRLETLLPHRWAGVAPSNRRRVVVVW